MIVYAGSMRQHCGHTHITDILLFSGSVIQLIIRFPNGNKDHVTLPSSSKLEVILVSISLSLIYFIIFYIGIILMLFIVMSVKM